MKENYEYDLVVIGAGPAGYIAAEESAKLSMKTALVENRQLGGTCLNRGCIPTKTLLHTAELYAEMKACEHLGIHVEDVSCDMSALQNRKEEVLEQLRSGIAALMKKSRVDVLQGTGTITSPHEVCVTGGKDSGRCLSAKSILIATGSVPARLPVPGADLPDVVTSDELLSKKSLYPRFTIIGGGVIGMEFASIYSALGAQVTVIESLDRILAGMDKEISQNLKMILKKRGVQIHTGARVESIRKNADGSLTCCFTEKEKQETVESDGILCAVGRRIFTDGLLGEGMELSMERGAVLVSRTGQTSVPSIYAAGDVTGGVQLAHAASACAINAVAHMAGQQPPVRVDLIPGCVYTSPEIASVGLTQDEARKQGRDVLIRKYPMSANGKTVLSGQERGFIKVVADSGSHKILGAQMMCARATDMISEFTTAIAEEMTLEDMGSVVRPHPTFSEAITETVRG